MPFADGALAQRLELNKAIAAVEYAQAQEQLRPGSTAVLPVAGGQVVYVGSASPISRAMGLGMKAPITPAELDQVEAFFAEHGAPPRLELCPLAHPSLLELVRERGYRIAHFRNALIRPTSPADSLPAADTPVRATQATSPEAKSTWLTVVAKGFLGKEQIVPEETWISQPMTQMPNVSCYLAQLGETTVGGGALGIRNRLAFLSSTSVLPSYRQQGAQSALLRARLAAAHSAGCDLVMVECTPGSPSQRNLERFGFRVAYTTMAVQRN